MPVTGTPTSAPTPLKPAAATPAGAIPEANKKSGTTIVKSAPPKETARITVKPSLPGSPTVKPAGATPVKAATPGIATPAAATTPVNIPGAAPKPGAAPAKAAVVAGAPAVAKPAAAGTVKPVSAAPVVLAEEGAESTMLTTCLAAGLMVLSWGTFGILIASYLNYI
jgi:hypothetical protein